MKQGLSLLVNHEIRLKQLKLSDASRIYELIDANRLLLRECLPWVDGNKDVADTERFISGSIKKWVEQGTFDLGIWYNHILVGVIGIHDLSLINKNAYIGYWLSSDYQGRGIMTQATHEVIRYLFEELKLHRVVIRAGTKNLKSQAIPQRLGFTKEGIEREAGFLYDHYVDLQVWSLLR